MRFFIIQISILFSFNLFSYTKDDCPGVWGNSIRNSMTRIFDCYNKFSPIEVEAKAKCIYSRFVWQNMRAWYEGRGNEAVAKCNKKALVGQEVISAQEVAFLDQTRDDFIKSANECELDYNNCILKLHTLRENALERDKSIKKEQELNKTFSERKKKCETAVNSYCANISFEKCYSLVLSGDDCLDADIGPTVILTYCCNRSKNKMSEEDQDACASVTCSSAAPAASGGGGGGNGGSKQCVTLFGETICE